MGSEQFCTFIFKSLCLSLLLEGGRVVSSDQSHNSSAFPPARDEGVPGLHSTPNSFHPTPAHAQTLGGICHWNFLFCFGHGGTSPLNFLVLFFLKTKNALAQNSAHSVCWMLPLSDIPFFELPPIWPARGPSQHGEKGDSRFPPICGSQTYNNTIWTQIFQQSSRAGTSHPPSYAAISPKQPRLTPWCFMPSSGTPKT